MSKKTTLNMNYINNTQSNNKVHTITYNLTNVTCSGDNEVADNEEFIANIRGKTGYSADYINVVMGNVDISDTCVSGAKITIEHVTDDVIITASGSEK